MLAQDNLHGLSNLAVEQQAILSQFGRGPLISASYTTVNDAFEAVVGSNPAVIAARFNNQSITYQELDRSANRLANHLIEAGLKPQQRVCLVVQRSFEMLVGILAILKAGCQYVPMDGGVTSEQAMKHIFTDSGARYVLCLPRYYDKVLSFVQEDAIIVNLNPDVGAHCQNMKPQVEVTSKDGAYAIYTSGSTGRPKGVDVSHKNVTNALLLDPARLGIKVGSKVAQVLNIGFDMGAWEILGCLMNGGTLYLRGSDWISTLSEVDTLVSTPSILSKYRPSSFPNIKCVATGGELCPQVLADEWATQAVFYNICGPTEVTILNSAYRHTPGQQLTIGNPLPNTTCYILDDDEQPVPPGQEGLMWVGGAGVTRGYINLPELTQSRYKPDRFMNDGSRMFNTGDIARWTEDGSLQMLGRKDDQVKIKGFRVELDGVCSVIEEFPNITRGTAFLIEGILHGFYASKVPISEEELDAFVRKRLPYYSVPEKWTHMESLPLTPNGKIDKRELRATTSLQTISPSTISLPSPTYAPVPHTEQNSIDSFSAVCQLSSSPSDAEKDVEKGIIVLETKTAKLSHSSARSSVLEIEDSLPPKNGFHGQRWIRHRAMILYRRFFSVVVLANIAVACFLLFQRIKENRYILANLATATAANLCVAVLMRSEPVVNLLFTVFCSVPTWFPLAIRRHCARIFHIGGIHSGCAIAAIGWFVIFVIGASLELAKPLEERCISLAPTILSYIVVVLFLAIGGTSHPEFRAKYHNAWEMTHRFGGWTCLILLWIQTFLATKDLNPGVAPSKAYLKSPPVWLLTVATAAIIFPWLFLRKVPVRSEVLSNHAVRLWFDYTTPVVGTAVRLAERPLVDWHGFATITNPAGQKGFSLIVSRAGDFTGRTIQRAPTHIYVRGIPTCGVLRIATLFKSVVLVATGSGIGPCLAVILAQKVPCRILWTAPNPEQTFGQEVVDSVKKTDPRAVIWNTRTMGKPDMSLLAWRLWRESGAEAVCVISNKKFTTKIVYDMEARGIPAYGAIFDS